MYNQKFEKQGKEHLYFGLGTRQGSARVQCLA